MSGSWTRALRSGLNRWCTPVRSSVVLGVEVQLLRPQCPLLLASGATPGPFYHSHPHIPAEFDHLQFDLASQLRYNAETIRNIGESVAQNELLPFEFSGNLDFVKSPLLINWISDHGPGFKANAAVCKELLSDAFSEQGIDSAESIGLFETGGNVSDRRFLLETFGMFGLVGEPLGPKPTAVRIDLCSLFDSVDEKRSVYTVGDKQYFMPYVPGYVVCGPADLAVFRVSAASGESTAPVSGPEQIDATISKLCEVLSSLDATFDDVVLLWNRVQDLNENENAVLMSRSQHGLTRPVAESVLEVTLSDPNQLAPDGTPIVLEYIAVVQVPRTNKINRIRYHDAKGKPEMKLG